MKGLLRSKTVWFHIVTALVSISTIGLVYVGQFELTQMQAMLTTMVLTLVQLFGGIWLRKITKSGIV